MDTAKKDRIVKLAKEVFLAEEEHKMLGLITVPNDRQQALDQFINYALARAKYQDAKAALDAEIYSV